MGFCKIRAALSVSFGPFRPLIHICNSHIPSLPTKPSAMPLPLPAVGTGPASAIGPVTAAAAAAPLRYRPIRLRASPSTASSPSTSAISSSPPPPSVRHSRKHLAGRGNAPARPSKDRVFFLDVNPICFRGSQRSLSAFARWLALFFTHVSLRDPVVAVSTPSQTLHRSRFVFSVNS